MADSIQIDMRVDNIAQLIGATESMTRELRKPENRRAIALAGSKFVVNAAVKHAPKSKKVHYRYSTPKLVGKLRAPKGFGVKAASYVPGNLKNSIIDISERRSKLRKVPVIAVGPYLARAKGKGPYGTTSKNADAYYASMVFGGAKAFQSEVMIKALLQSKTIALNEMKGKAAQIIRQLGTKNGLA